MGIDVEKIQRRSLYTYMLKKRFKIARKFASQLQLKIQRTSIKLNLYAINATVLSPDMLRIFVNNNKIKHVLEGLSEFLG